MIFSVPRQLPLSTGPGAARMAAHSRNGLSPALFVLGTALALGTAVLLFAAPAQAQAASAAPVPAAASAEPRYTVAQIAQAFSFIDGNKDGKLSREEAAGFRGVARHFDEADANKDGALSREEFEHALSGEKSR